MDSEGYRPTDGTRLPAISEEQFDSAVGLLASSQEQFHSATSVIASVDLDLPEAPVPLLPRSVHTGGFLQPRSVPTYHSPGNADLPGFSPPASLDGFSDPPHRGSDVSSASERKKYDLLHSSVAQRLAESPWRDFANIGDQSRSKSKGMHSPRLMLGQSKIEKNAPKELWQEQELKKEGEASIRSSDSGDLSSTDSCKPVINYACLPAEVDKLIEELDRKSAEHDPRVATQAWVARHSSQMGGEQAAASSHHILGEVQPRQLGRHVAL